MEKDSTRFASSLEGKTVVLAVTASISIYRIPDLIRDLRREGARVIVGMSREAVEMINPEVMRWASENDVIVKVSGNVEHINQFVGDSVDTLLLVCPASYNFIGKAASGISDDVPSLFFSFALGNGNPVVIAPVMHEGMMVNPVNRMNLEKLEKFGVIVVPPLMEAMKAKISESDKIIDYVSRAFHGKSLRERKILVIGGRGEEKIDPVRGITNSGTGLTAAWMVKSAFRLGAGKIAYIGNTEYGLQDYVNEIPARYMDEYEKAVAEALGSEKYDAVINVASLPDFELKEKFTDKIVSSNPIDLHLTPRKKLNEEIRKLHKGILVVFKLARKSDASDARESFSGINPELIVFNHYTEENVPFGNVSNEYKFITGKEILPLGKLSKPDLTIEIVKAISSMLG